MNTGRKHNFQAWLVPYAEGALDHARAARLEARLARDPALAAELAAIRAVAAHLREAGAQTPAGADPRLSLDPAPLWPGVQRRLTPAPRLVSRPARWAGGVCAASLALGALLLHGSGLGVQTRPLPPAVVTRIANRGGAASSTLKSAPRARHKKTGRRPVSRPMHLALSRQKPGLFSRLPAQPIAALPPRPDIGPSAPTLVPAAPSAHSAVALGEGQARFRLASPVHDDKPNTDAPPASGIPASRPEDAAPVPERATPPDDASPAPADPAPAQDDPASPSSATPAPALRAARRAHRHRPRHRHSRRHHAAPGASATPAVSMPPAAAPPNTHASRAI